MSNMVTHITASRCFEHIESYFTSSVIRHFVSFTIILATLFGAIGISAEESAAQKSPGLSIEKALADAQKNDPWITGNRLKQDAIEAMSVVAGALPDPKMSFGLANIATDSFDFNQERMTQFKVGVSQMIPRGRSLSIKREQLELVGSQFPHQREDRKARVSVTVAKLWLDAYKAQESIALIEQDRALFEQLVDVAQASYSAALGKTRQQDIVRAQLELTRLDDRLTTLKLKQESSLQRLSEWLSEYQGGVFDRTTTGPTWPLLVRELPEFKMREESLFKSKDPVDPEALYGYLSLHPAVLAINQKIKASKSGIELARQNYKPAWGVNASYGLRGDAPDGMNRADLFSLGVTVDLPFFTANRQDKQLRSAVKNSAAIETEKWLLIRRLSASFEATRVELYRLNERQTLYHDRLLPQMHEQAEASLTAYTNDDGDFAEVVRSRIAELNASIDDLGISVDRQKSIVQMNYLFITKASDLLSYGLSSSPSFGESK